MTVPSGSLPEIVVLGAPDLEPPRGIERLTGYARLRHTDAAGLAAALPGARALLMWDHFSPALRDAWPAADALEWIHVAAAGVDHIMFDELVASPVTVTNSRGVFDRPIAEWALAVLLAHVKDLRTTWADTTAHRWHYREPVALAGSTAVVVGTGAIGRAVGRMLRAMGVRVRGVARRARPADPDFDEVVGADAIVTAVADADHLVVAAPLTAATRGLVDARVLAALPPHAHLVNVGRGPIVDTAALVEALHAGRLAAASLDVLDEEPPAPDDPVWSAPGVLISPHCSGDVVGWRDTLADLFLANAERFAAGVPLANVVDKEAGFVAGTPAGPVAGAAR